MSGNYKQKDIQTFQQLYNIIANDKNFKFTKFKSEILYEAAKRFKQNTLLQFPSELSDIFNK